MSAKDKHYKPRRFREDSDDKTEKKLKGSVSAKKYMADQKEEYGSDQSPRKEDAPAVRIPSRVRVPAEDAKAPVRRPAASSSAKAAGAEPKPEIPAEKPETARVNEAPVSKKTEAAEKPAAAEIPAAKTESEEAEVKTETAESPAAEPESVKEAEGETEAAEKAASEAPADKTESEGGSAIKLRVTEKSEVEEEKSFDYVVPGKRHSHQSHHSHHSHHSSHSSHHGDSGSSGDDPDGFDEDYLITDSNPDHYSQLKHRPKRGMSKPKKVLITILCVILALIIAIAGTFLIMREIGRKQMHNYSRIDITAPSEDESGNYINTLDATGRVIKYDGVSYEFNDNIMSIAFIGFDMGSGADSDKRMGDAIYILAVDAKTGDTKILGISRDTMTDVDIYSDEGKFIDTEKRQLTYAYSYSSDEVTGGQNTLTSLSRLFYGLPMTNYFALDMDALITLNDAIGGVTLTSSMTFVSPEDGRTINEGETVTLHGAEAERYVRSRDVSELESNNDRMKRQQEYIRAFISSVLPAAKKDISVVTNLYNAIKENSDSSLDITKITYIASTALSHMNDGSEIEYINLKGKIVKGTNAEMYVTNEDTIRTMLDVFYKPIKIDSGKETGSAATAAPTAISETVQATEAPTAAPAG